MGAKEESRMLRFPVLRKQQYFDRRQKGTAVLPSRLFLICNDQMSFPVAEFGPLSRKE